MKKQLIIFLPVMFTFLLFNSCNSVPGFAKLSGDIVTDPRNVPSFDAISVTSGIELIISQGSEQRVSVKADKDILNEIKTEVVGSELKIYCNRSFWKVSNISVEVTITGLNALKASAGSDIKSTQTLKLNQIGITLSSGSNLHFDVDAQSVELTASSGSDVNLSGRSGMLTIRSSSGSDINANNLESNEVTIRTSSGSDVHVSARGSLNVEATGGSDVYVNGKPEKQNISTSGGSDVYFK